MKTEKLLIDDGLVRLDINGNGVLTFNPSDLNVYDRFCALVKELPELEQKYISEVESLPEDAQEEQVIELAGRELARAKEVDTLVKKKLAAVFGADNDFDKLLGGVNIMAFGGNGERIITNLLNALLPYIEKGVEKHTQSEVAAAKSNRDQRRAAQKKDAKK